MSFLIELSPLIGQVEGGNAQEWLTRISVAIAGAMAFWALKEINDKLSKVLDKMGSAEQRIAIIETKVERIENQLDDQ